MLEFLRFVQAASENSWPDHSSGSRRQRHADESNASVASPEKAFDLNRQQNALAHPRLDLINWCGELGSLVINACKFAYQGKRKRFPGRLYLQHQSRAQHWHQYFLQSPHE